MWTTMQLLYVLFTLIRDINLSNGLTYQTNYKNAYVFAATRSDGSVVLWGGVAEGAVGVVNDVAQLASSTAAVALIQNDGSLLCYGNSNFGGDCSGVVSTDIQSLYSVNRASAPLSGAFGGLDSTGQVITWGSSASGADFSDVAPLLTSGVLSLEVCGEGFVAVKPNEVLVPWGASSVGDPDLWSVVDRELASGAIERIYGGDDAFCVLKDDATVFCWGDPANLGTIPVLANVADVFVTESAFAALHTDGTVTTWGDASNGGAPVVLAGVAFIYSTLTAFAALHADGTVTAWGDAANGGDLSGATGGPLADIIAIYPSDYGFVALSSAGVLTGWGQFADPTSAGISSPIVHVVSTSRSFAALGDNGVVYSWGVGADTVMTGPTAAILASGTVSSIFAVDNAFAAIYGPLSQVVCWGNVLYGGDCSGYADQLTGVSYIYGNEMRKTAVFQAPTVSPSASPSSKPSSARPTAQPVRPTVSPTVSQRPTKSPQVAPFPTKSPTFSPSGKPTFSLTPVIDGDDGNMTYYCRPRNFVSGKNAFQRIDPDIVLIDAGGIVNATVWVDPYESTDELSLRGSYGGDPGRHGIFATYSLGTLQMSRVAGYTDYISWENVLRNAAYQFSDYLKPCAKYRKKYYRKFCFQVRDNSDRASNVFCKGLTIETASVTYSNDNTVQISQKQRLDVNGNSAVWIEARPQ